MRSPEPHRLAPSRRGAPYRGIDEMVGRLNLGAKFTLLLALVFVAGMALSWIALSKALQGKAEREVLSKAQILLKSMNSVRQYTTENINIHVKPLIGEHDNFISETVPGYAARQVFEFFRRDNEYRDFRYKEATLNPTNPLNQADEFEAALVARFREQPQLTEQTGFHQVEGSSVFFAARPIRVKSATCLECHSVPSAAPATMLARYGSQNGFGWRMNEVVGSQIVYVPSGQVFGAGQQSAFLVSGIFVAIFALAVLAITVFFRRAVVRPLGGLAAATQALTRGAAGSEAPHAAAAANPRIAEGDEIGQLAERFEFMAREVYSREEKLRQAFSDLSRSQERLVNAQRIAQIGHWDWDLASDEVTCSDEISRILGFETGQFAPTSKKLLEVVHPADREGLSSAIVAAIKGTRPLNHELRIIRPGGAIRVVHEQGEVTFDESGKAVHLQGTVQDITERKHAAEQIRQLEFYDSLTGLPNRHLFKEQLSQGIASARRTQQVVVVLSLGLDRFKRVNDTLGHEGGDRLLKEAANRLSKSLRATDYVARDGSEPIHHSIARPGGDEFTVLLAVEEAEDAGKIARRILETLSQPFRLGSDEVVVSASIGVALFPLDAHDADGLLKNADTAMHFAKDQGKNNFQYYNGTMNASAAGRLALESKLHRAVERGEFSLYYQPKIAVHTGAIVGVEALIRWRHPDMGLVSPAEFIPLAEDTGLIIPIGEWVLRTACAQLAQWREAGLAPVPVAVNISPKQFHQQDIAEIVLRALSDHDVEPSLLDIEITESTAMRNPEATTTTLRNLKALGVRIAIDDFGTGYSSLSYLKRFPIDSLKIDRSFITGLPGDRDDGSIACAVITMAHALRLNVVAEGVENAAQLTFLAAHGCDEMQGFYFSRPLPVEEITAFMVERPELPLASAEPFRHAAVV